MTAKPAAYAAIYEFNWLSASGTACFLAASRHRDLSARETEPVCQGLQGHVQPASEVDGDNRRNAWSRLPDELLGDDIHPRTCLGGHRVGVSVLQRRAGVVWGVPDRQRHIGQRSLWQSPSCYRQRARTESCADGLDQLRRRRHGQDDLAAEHRRRGRRDRNDPADESGCSASLSSTAFS